MFTRILFNLCLPDVLVDQSGDDWQADPGRAYYPFESTTNYKILWLIQTQ